MSRALSAALLRLAQSGNARLPASQLSIAQRQALDEFCRRTGAAVLQRSGRGAVYRLLSAAVVHQHLGELAPDVLSATDDDLPIRSANIGRARSSKAGQHRHACYYLLLRARGPVSWTRDDNTHLDLARMTREQGAAVLALGTPCDQGWVSDSPLWLVENQALFDRLDWLPGSNSASVACYSGQLQGTLIQWLTTFRRAPHIHFFPDYDGVGLHNYLRLKRQLGEHTSLWLMPDWQQKLARYGSNSLWQDTRNYFETAASGLAPWLTEEPALKQLLTVMQSQGLALEQEAVWLMV